MNKKQRAEFIAKKLEELFPDPAIPLQHDDPFTLLIAVLLSAQSTDARVNQCTPALFAKARNPKEMAALDTAEIAAIIRPIGLSPSKSRAISGLSRDLIEKHQGKVPRSFAALEALPGVGHKTASVVMAQAFHHPAFPVDTHIHRCAKRWGLSHGKSVKETERDLKRLFPRNTWNKLHLQIIYFARTYCPARSHKVENCPICSEISKG